MCFENCTKWMEKSIRKMQWYDVSLVKLVTAAIVLLLAKYFPVLLSAEWHWYVIIAVLGSILPMKHMFCSDKKKKK